MVGVTLLSSPSQITFTCLDPDPGHTVCPAIGAGMSRKNFIIGALDGTSPMSHVDFKKWQCRTSLSL